MGHRTTLSRVSARYERGSIMLTSNKTYGEWGDIFSDQVLAAAILDRLLCRGEAYRLKDTRNGGSLSNRRGESGDLS